MTKSYAVFWVSAVLALSLVTTNAFALAQEPAPFSELTAELSQSETSASDDESAPIEAGLPLFPLVESAPDSRSELSEDKQADVVNLVVAERDADVVDNESGSREFVIYVVRHMEKEESTLDPGLTSGGLRRADGLGQLLSTADVERIYSTLYRRSASTALPLARRLAIPVEFYQPDAGNELVETLLDAGQSALVVGHSNTVADLITALGGTAEALSEEKYGDIFQLIIRIDGDHHDVRQIHLKAPLIATERRGSR